MHGLSLPVIQLGAKFYIDGFVDGPMYDEGSALLICPRCNRYFWREDVPTRESMPDHEYFGNPQRRSLPSAIQVRGSHYRHALHQALWKTSAQEKYIRIRAWWSFNSAHRGNITEEFGISPEEEANLLRLLQLLDTNDPHDSIMKAEILRELGQFDECLKQLDQPFDDRYLPTIDIIKKLATCKKRQVGTIE